jgi:hypothetical protein
LNDLIQGQRDVDLSIALKPAGPVVRREMLRDLLVAAGVPDPHEKDELGAAHLMVW